MEPEVKTTPPTPGPVAAKKPTIWIVLFIVVLVIAAVMAYLWWQAANDATMQRQAAAHAKTVAKATDAQQIDKDTPATVDPAKTGAVDDDDAAIIAMTGAYAHSMKGSETAKYNIAIVKKELPFARTTVNGVDEIGGYTCVLKKTDGIWLILFCGQSSPLQEELDKWGVPASILP